MGSKSLSHLADILEVHVRKLAIGLTKRVVQGPLGNATQAAEEVLFDTKKVKEYWTACEHRVGSLVLTVSS